MKSRSKGFTLIELLVVISIISLLSSVVLSSLNSARVKARDVLRKSTLSEIKTALSVYFLTNGSYPSGTFFSVWDAQSGRNPLWWGGNPALYNALVGGALLSQLSQDPSGGYEAGGGNFLGDNTPTDMGYVYVSDGVTFTLGTNLEAGGTASFWGNYQLTN